MFNLLPEQGPNLLCVSWSNQSKATSRCSHGEAWLATPTKSDFHAVMSAAGLLCDLWALLLHGLSFNKLINDDSCVKIILVIRVFLRLLQARADATDAHALDHSNVRIWTWHHLQISTSDGVPITACSWVRALHGSWWVTLAPGYTVWTP